MSEFWKLSLLSSASFIAVLGCMILKNHLNSKHAIGKMGNFIKEFYIWEIQHTKWEIQHILYAVSPKCKNSFMKLFFSGYSWFRAAAFLTPAGCR